MASAVVEPTFAEIATITAPAQSDVVYKWGRPTTGVADTACIPEDLMRELYREMNVLLDESPMSLQQTALTFLRIGRRAMRYSMALRICRHLVDRVKMWSMRGDVVIANQFDAVVALMPREVVKFAPTDESSDEEFSEDCDFDLGGKAKSAA